MLKPTQRQTQSMVPQGTYAAILYSIVDIGLQTVQVKNDQTGRLENKQIHKVIFSFELPNEKAIFDGVEKPLVISNRYTLSMHNKSSLRPVIEALIGTSLLDQEAYNFDIEKFRELLGNKCMINVVHKTSGDKTYANIASVVPLPKGMTVPAQFNDNVLFELGTTPVEEIENLPQFMQDAIMKSEEMQPKGNLTDEDKEKLAKVRNAFGKKTEEDEDFENLASNIPF